MTAPWWAGLPPVRLPIRCHDAANHVLTWADGALAAPDHPDGDRERALVALGAPAMACLQVLDRWQRHVDDLDVLLLGSRGPADRLPVADLAQPGTVSQVRGYVASLGYPLSRRGGPMIRHGGGWYAYSPAYGSTLSVAFDGTEDEAGDEVEQLLSLGGGLPDRLVATVLARWTERMDEHAAKGAPGVEHAALRAAVYGRAAVALRNWLGVDLEVELVMPPPGELAGIVRDGERLLVRLPFRWLSDVWIRGLAVVLGRFCLSAEPTGPDTWTLLTVGSDLAEPRRVTISG